ncbi:MAG: hypothetical protein Q4C72_09500 [Eubacteriales bacterium]|nr:hypothetical protein [Eubacteriales bacterium]
MKIHFQLRLLWLALAVTVFTNFLSFSNAVPIQLACSLAELAAAGLITFVLSRLAGESARFHRAFIYQLLSFTLSVLLLVCALIPSANDTLLVFTSLLSLTGGIAALLGKYQMYWALDERIIPLGYVFPARRIRLCFYVPLLGAVLSAFALAAAMTPQINALAQLPEAALAQAQLPQPTPAQALPAALIQIVCQVIPLVLLFRYMRAVKAREDDPLPG